MSSYRPLARLAFLACIAILFTVAAFLFPTTAAVQADTHIIYVRAQPTPAPGVSQNGQSWDSAYTKLQDALSAAVAGKEIWVAKGVYYPDEGQGKTNNSAEMVFSLKAGVNVYGGFIGNETSRDQRNPAANVTVLSGDIDNNDTGKNADGVLTSPSGITGRNSYHVVYYARKLLDTAGDPTLDGFTITGGDATYSEELCAVNFYNCGGGMLVPQDSFVGIVSNPHLANLHFVANRAKLDGGGLWMRADTSTLTNVTFKTNHAPQGGGMFLTNSSAPVLTGLSFVSNVAWKDGGGFYASNSNVTIDDSLFNRNIVHNNGGGIYIEGGSLEIQHTVFEGNLTALDHGGGLYSENTPVKLSEVNFVQNEAHKNGGAFFSTNTGNPSAVISLTDVTMTKNRSGDPGAGSAGAFLQYHGTLNMLRVLISRNSSVSEGGGLYLHNVIASMSDVQFLGNYVGRNSPSPLGLGGGLYIRGGQLLASNLLLSGNRGIQAGALYLTYTRAEIHTATFGDNEIPTPSATTAEAILVNDTASLLLTNSVIWDGSGEIAVRKVGPNTDITMRNTLTQGENGTPDGNGNIQTPTSPFRMDADPGNDGFGNNPGTDDDESANDNYGDLRLKPGAPAIDMGDNDRIPADVLDVDGDGDVDEKLPLDLDDLPRITHVSAATPRVDMGAYEYQNVAPTAQINGPYAISEGGFVALDATGSTDDAGIVNYAWDCTNDGITDVNETTPSAGTCVYGNNGVYTLRLTVTDTPGATGSATTTVTVANVAPVYTPASNQSTFAGNAKLFALGSFTDPGAEGAWSVTIDWGDNSTPTQINANSAGTLPTAGHTYATQGTYNVVVTVGDGDASDDGGFQIIVNPTPAGAPIVTAPANQSAIAGVEKSFSLGSFTDVGSNGPWQVTITWGDGSPNTQFSAPASGAIDSRSHTYSANGTYDVLVSVNDGALTGSASFQVTVSSSPDNGSIVGMVFADANDNGAHDEGETGVAGVEVSAENVTQASAFALDLSSATVTGGDGRYRFDNLPPGDYRLTFAPPSGYQGDGIGAVTVTVQAGKVANAPSVAMQRKGSQIHLPTIHRLQP